MPGSEGKADSTTIRVRGYHEDRFGHVNNARYLEFLEEGRWSYLEKRGPLGGFGPLGVLPVVVQLSIVYRRPAIAGDVLEVETQISEVGRRRFTLHQVVRSPGEDRPCCTADVTVVLVDKETGRPAVLSEEIRRAWPDLETVV